MQCVRKAWLCNRWTVGMAASAAVLAVVCVTFAVRRPQAVERQLGPGVTYRRVVADSPRPYIAHLVWVDLSNPQIGFFVTPSEYSGDLPFSAMTVGEFLNHYGMLVAVNGDYFTPWHNNSPIDYYPRRSDPVACQGISASAGEVTMPRQPGYFARGDATIYFSEDGRIGFERPPGKILHALSGGPILIREGEIADFPASAVHPQTAIGFDPIGRRLLLLVVDGRQPGYSEGLTNHELAGLMLQAGCYWALRLDGGGSSTMAALTPDGRSTVLNSPIHSGVPGWQRPVANHFGVYLR